MSAAKVVILLLQASIFLTVFTLGLRATFQDAAWLLQRPRLLLRSLVAMNVIMPLFAAFLAAAFHLHPAVKAALVLLAVSPVPPILPWQQLKLGGSSAYVMGLLVTTSLLAIVLVPLTIKLLAVIFNVDVGIRPASVAKVVVTTVLLPLTLGLVVHAQAPGLAQRSAPGLAKAAFATLVLAAAPLLVVEWRSMIVLIGNGTLVSIAAFILGGVAAGHLLGGPDPANRATLELATASRHPGLAMAIASANFPGQFRSIAAAILLYLLVKAVVLIPYNAWSKRRHATKPEVPHGRQAA
jgi:bile acid:Na+ symporter, BASS family